MELTLSRKGAAFKPLLLLGLLVVAFCLLRTAFGQLSADGMLLLESSK